MSNVFFQKKVKKNLIKLIDQLPYNISDDAKYFLEGKKLRSNLMYEIAKLLNCSIRGILTPASVLELIHTTTIIHDDVLDHTKLRRGKKTIHSIYKKRITVFTADYLISTCLREFTKNSTAELSNIFFRKIKTVCEGEIKQDFNNDFNKPLSIDDCIDIAAQKTGALFSLSFLTPAIIAKTKEESKKLIEEIGLLYGTIYQLLDDYNDILFDVRTEKNNAFKYWTVTTVLWNEIAPGHLRHFLKNGSIQLNETIREKILDQLFAIVHSLIEKVKNKIMKIGDKSVNKCFKLVDKEINAFSPRPVHF